MIFWHGVFKELGKSFESRSSPRYTKYSKFLSTLNQNSLKEIEGYGWITIADTSHNLIILDPVKGEQVLTAKTSVTMHTLIPDPVGFKIIAMGYEKAFWVYDTSKYYSEIRSISMHKAHISTIVGGTIIPKRRLIVSCDETGIIRSWDLDTMMLV